MKKTFQFKVPGNDDKRVVEAIKGDVRKYLKRERRKTLPEGFDQWDFNCRIGPDAEAPITTPVQDIIGAIDALAQAGKPAVYIEILSAPGHRPQRISPNPAISADPTLPTSAEPPVE